MTGSRTIVGIGEALLIEAPGRREPGGLALRTALEAARLGHTGVAVSRLGQDPFAADLQRALAERGLDTSHLQSDPDLPSGRVIRRTLGEEGRSANEREAYDNLQWDHDLTDLAHQTDAVVFGLRATRYAQTRSVVQQFLGECRSALRVLDLTNRPPQGRADRGVAAALIGDASAALLDREALQLLFPGQAARPAEEQVRHLVRQSGLDLAVLLEEEPRDALSLAVISERERWNAPGAIRSGLRATATVAIVHGVLCGLDMPATLDLLARVIGHVEAHPAEAIPQAILRPGG